MCEDGISVFNKNKYFPAAMTPKCIDHDWVLDLGFDNDSHRADFLKKIKEALRDYWYGQVTN